MSPRTAPSPRHRKPSLRPPALWILAIIVLATAELRLGSVTAVAAEPAPATSGGVLHVPASTAYVLPDPDGARVGRNGITRWTDPAQHVNWYGLFRTSGDLHVKLEARLPGGQKTRLKMQIGETAVERTLEGAGETTSVLDFGNFSLARTGYHRIELTLLDAEKQPARELVGLALDGPAAVNAHFNLLPRRNAASVHLGYPVPAGTGVNAFYCEMTGLEDPVHTYYMACGWHRGYFGMQVNSATERRIIFSVWDSGGEAVDRKKVKDVDRVQLVAKGEEVFSGDFGNEGTGGHSHLKYAWKTGERQRFLVTAVKADDTHVVFSGHYWHPDLKRWFLVSSWKAPGEKGGLRGLYSFSENFAGNTGHLLRKARYGNQWARTDDGRWIELTQARFTHDLTGKKDRLDRYMGLESGEFFLSHGGFLPDTSTSGDLLSRPALGKAPEGLPFP